MKTETGGFFCVVVSLWKVKVDNGREGFWCEIRNYRSRRNRCENAGAVAKDSEIDGLVYEVVRMGERYHVPVPMYAKVYFSPESV